VARKSKKPINMSALLQTSTGTLAQIQEKTNSLALLSDIVRQICPDLPIDAFHIANCRQDTLIIEVKSPVWGQRLQFERNNICRHLVIETDGNFQKLQIKVNPQGFRPKSEERASFDAFNNTSSHKVIENFVASPKTAKHIMEVAKNAPKGLKEKLEKLARVAGKNTFRG
jgi:hypothetical protein